MQPKLSPKITLRASRQILTIPHKEIKMRNFFDEKICASPNRLYVHCSNTCYRNQIHVTLRPSVTFNSPKSSFYNGTKAHSGYFRPKDDKITRVLKFNQGSAGPKSRGNSLYDTRSFHLKSSTEEIPLKYSTHSNLIPKVSPTLNHPGLTSIRK